MVPEDTALNFTPLLVAIMLIDILTKAILWKYIDHLGHQAEGTYCNQGCHHFIKYCSHYKMQLNDDRQSYHLGRIAKCTCALFLLRILGPDSPSAVVNWIIWRVNFWQCSADFISDRSKNVNLHFLEFQTFFYTRPASQLLM